MRSETLALTESIHASTEAIVTVLERARDSLEGDELIEVLATAISYCGKIDATVNRILGGCDEVTDEEELHRRRHLDITQVANGGYVLTGFLTPEAGATLERALELVIQQQDAARRTAGQRSKGPGQPQAWPFSSPSTAPAFVMPTQGAQNGRNRPCRCGSGCKYKHCCGR